MTIDNITSVSLAHYFINLINKCTDNNILMAQLPAQLLPLKYELSVYDIHATAQIYSSIALA